MKWTMLEFRQWVNEGLKINTTVTELCLTTNNKSLYKFLEYLVYLTSLTTLRIKYCTCIDSLPESIGNLTQLVELYINDSDFTTLPESIGNLVNLRVLNIDNNRLTALPENIGNLELSMLSVDNNNFNSFPKSIYQWYNYYQIKRTVLKNKYK